MTEVHLRPMVLSDLPGVMAIEEVSFPTPWSPQAYRTELTQNDLACYVVAIAGEALVGYGGMWVVMEEAHITTLAVHPDQRRRGIASRVMLELARLGRLRGAERVRLEVRESNHAAQALYHRWGFRAVGRRRGYYSDTREDAVVMVNDDLESLAEGRSGVGGRVGHDE